MVSFQSVPNRCSSTVSSAATSNSYLAAEVLANSLREGEGVKGAGMGAGPGWEATATGEVGWEEGAVAAMVARRMAVRGKEVGWAVCMQVTAAQRWEGFTKCGGGWP